MSAGDLLVGSAALGVLVAAALFAAVRIRRRWLPGCSGALAHLVDAVNGIAIVIGTSQALGAVGLFKGPALVLAVAVVAAATWRLDDRAGPPGAPPRSPTGVSRSAVVAVLLVALVAGQWTSFAVDATQEGIVANDSTWYHLPRAAEFARSGSLTDLHYTAPEFPDTFHPSNAELVHAIPMLVFGRDLLSPLLNHGWLALLLLAAWCLGARRGVGAASVAAAAALLATPLLVIEGAGNAGNDIATTFFLLAAVALLLHREKVPGLVAVAGVAAGLAISTKLTVVPVLAVLTLGIILVEARAGRWRTVVTWSLPLVAFGSYWYVRNWIAVGTPVPSTRLPLLPAPRFRIADELGYSVLDYATDTTVWREWFGPGLRADFGLLWPIVLALLVVAVVGALRAEGRPLTRWTGAALAVGTVAYAALPTTALGPRGEPILFAGNVIYLAPLLILAVVLLPGLLARWSGRAELAFLALCGLVALSAVTTSPLDTWAAGRASIALAVAAAVGAVGATLVLLRWRPSGLLVGVGAAAAALGLIVVVAPSADDRYRSRPFYAWAGDRDVERIAVAGFAGSYPLYGPDLGNQVRYVGVVGDHGEFHDQTSCAAWRRALRAGRFDHVALRPERSDTDAAQLRWTQTDPAATLRFEHDGGQVFRFDPLVPDPGCEGAAAP